VFCIPVLAAEMTTGWGALSARKRSTNFLIFNYFCKSLSICKRLADIKSGDTKGLRGRHMTAK